MHVTTATLKEAVGASFRQDGTYKVVEGKERIEGVKARGFVEVAKLGDATVLQLSSEAKALPKATPKAAPKATPLKKAFGGRKP